MLAYATGNIALSKAISHDANLAQYLRQDGHHDTTRYRHAASAMRACGSGQWVAGVANALRS